MFSKLALMCLVVLCVACSMEEPASPTARFVAENVGCVAPCTVNFRDSSENRGVYNWKYAWSINDTLNFSYVRDTSLLFSKAGLYKVKLTLANDKYGTSSFEDTIRIAEPVKPPVANFLFTMKDSPKKDSMVVSFNNISVNAISYSWDFGDSTKSVEMSPVHRFARGKADAKFTVTLTALAEGATHMKSDTIKIKKK